MANRYYVASKTLESEIEFDFARITELTESRATARHWARELDGDIVEVDTENGDCPGLLYDHITGVESESNF